ncbi:FRG domain-containing protein [Bacillus subtilis]|uniref:FRG domain-containing protein n=1 Tax=Bacillus subtilis TaxID=1423 RepID=UPI000F466FAB|nr:FRG domain-containing protein [Bacillus subtilis]MCL6427467.1 FRG domain-containing protein [Bacillus subtilis]ROT25725.1 FRG domain-containing protein [Bacillus subtilis]
MEQANNLSHFKEMVQKHSNGETYYRGQLSNYTNINSSISRDKGYVLNEDKIFTESVLIMPNEFEHIQEPIDYLAKMQHYNIPTRLIDMTVNPLIALFFAVENVDDENDGIVYIFNKNGEMKDCKHVRLLSLLAKINDYTFSFIQKKYEEHYDENITIPEITQYSTKPAFIKYSQNEDKTNIRITNQKGTFAICCNEMLSDGTLGKNIMSLVSDIKVKIRIPYEYKKVVKQELDNIGINKAFIYPELPSVGDYVREKYKYRNYAKENIYTIVNTQDLSTGAAKRLLLVVVLENPRDIEQIKVFCKTIINGYQKSQDVVWIYIAKSGEDYKNANWIMRAQWIRPTLNELFKPLPIGNSKDEEYYWDYSEDYSVISDFYKTMS